MTTLRALTVDLYRWVSRWWVFTSVVASIAVWTVILIWPTQKELTIIFCRAGQGDEILIQRGFEQILIDGSRPGQALGCLERYIPFVDRTIDVVVVTHPQLDHYGGLTDVLKRYRLKYFIYNGYSSQSKEWAQLSAFVRSNKTTELEFSLGDELRIGEVVIKTVWPNRREGSKEPQNSQGEVLGIAHPSGRDPNEFALVFALHYNAFDALFTSDIGSEQEQLLLAGHNDEALTGVDVLKVAHHGSKFSSSTGFLGSVHPKIAVIEVGKNSYGHPSPQTIARLKDIGASVFRTDVDGDVVVTTNGDRWSFKTVRE